MSTRATELECPVTPGMPRLDWLVPGKPFFRVSEIAAQTGLSGTFIEDTFGPSGKCHRYNGASGKRLTMRIPRAFVIELLVCSAGYDTETKVRAVESLAREFTPEECLRIAAVFQAAATSATPSSHRADMSTGVRKHTGT